MPGLSVGCPQVFGIDGSQILTNGGLDITLVDQITAAFLIYPAPFLLRQDCPVRVLARVIVMVNFEQGREKHG